MPTKDDDGKFTTFILGGLALLGLSGRGSADDGNGDGDGNGDSNGGGDDGGGNGDGNGGGQENQPPTASVTASLDENAGMATFDASGSSDPDGQIVSYDWMITKASTVIAQPVGQTVTVDLPETGFDYTGFVTVTDDQGATADASAEVTWSPGLSTVQPDFSVTQDGDSWTIDGSLTDTGEWSLSSYEIEGQQQSGTGSFSASWATIINNCCTTVSPPPGTYDVTFTVHVSQGSLFESVSINRTVNFSEGGGNGSNGTQNQPPVASFTEERIGVSVEVDPSPSHDPDGEIDLYEWEVRFNGELQYTRTDHGGDLQTFLFGQGPGTYEYILTVTDDDGAKATDRGSVTLTDGGGDNGGTTNQPPTAAFAYNVTNGGERLELDAGDSFDPDGSIQTYDWEIDRNGSHWIDLPNQGVTTSTSISPSGDYTVTLTVTDDDGAADTATQSFSVQDTNEPPNAVISVTQQQTEFGAELHLSAGQSSDPDGVLVSAEWQITGPEPGDLINRSGFDVTVGPLSPNIYTVSLTVLDNEGATDTDSRNVTIEDPIEGMEHKIRVQPVTEPLSESSAGILFESTGSAIVAVGAPQADGNRVQWDAMDDPGPVTIAYDGIIQTFSWANCALITQVDGENVDPYELAPDPAAQPRQRWTGGTSHVVEATIYTTREIYEKHGWTPARTNAEWLAGNLEWHGISYDICYLLGPMDSPSHDAGCPQGGGRPAKSYWSATVHGEWNDPHSTDDGQRVEGPLTTLRKNNNVLLIDSAGGGCHDVGGDDGVAGADGLDSFVDFSGGLAEEGTLHNRIYVYLHETAHGIARYAHVNRSGGEGFYDDQMRWHATPAGQDTIGSARENVCGELIEERFPNQTQGRVWHLTYTDCTAGMIREQSQTHSPGILGNQVDLTSRPPEPGCSRCGCAVDQPGGS